MPTTTGFEFGDVVLVPFPFTDQSALKKRPAVVISSTSYHQHRPDIIIMAITSQLQPFSRSNEMAIHDWEQAGLLKPSVVKPVMTTLAKQLVYKKLGHLQTVDLGLLKEVIRSILG